MAAANMGPRDVAVTVEMLWGQMQRIEGVMAEKLDGLSRLLLEKHQNTDHAIEKLERDVNVLFERQRVHGNRLAQVSIIAITVGVLIPCLATLWAAKIAAPPPPPPPPPIHQGK